MEWSVDSIIQGGAVGIAVLLILYAAWKDRLYFKSLEKFNDSLTQHTSTINRTLVELSKQVDKANNNHTNTVSVLDRNTRVFGNVERLLERILESAFKK
jgi:ABC-type transporter Mla subunit MlaD